jgi:hypothetical protein
MLEEVAFLLNNGRQISLIAGTLLFTFLLNEEGKLPGSQDKEEWISLVEQQIGFSCSPEMSVTNVLTKFFQAELRFS